MSNEVWRNNGRKMVVEQRANNEKYSNEQLVSRIQAGIDTADNMLALWNQNQRFITMIAKKYISGAELEDLEQEGYLALCEAVSKYDSGKGILFISYAAYWMKQYMTRYVEKTHYAARVPSYAYQRLVKYHKFQSAFQQEYGRKPSDSEIAEHLWLSLEQITQLKKDACAVKIQSLDKCIGDEEESITLADTLASTEDIERSVLDRQQEEHLHKTIWKVVDALDGTQADILHYRYQGSMTLKAIGERMGMSPEHIRQQEAQALRTLRRPKQSHQLRPFLEDYITSCAYRGSGADTFKRTWTSSTEYAALELVERRRQQKERQRKREYA